MKKVIDKSDSRGHSLYDWLDSHHTFSFDEYGAGKTTTFYMIVGLIKPNEGRIFLENDEDTAAADCKCDDTSGRTLFDAG